ncbi:MAG: FkbM family methyltransferase [Candidatus Shapirobacteria bacterium]|jgi:FkbM family methyltransferase
MKLIKTRVRSRDFWYQEDDKYVGQRIALGKYEPYLTKVMLNQVQHDKTETVIDVGANIGYYTVMLADKAKQVIAIEPEEKTFGVLKKNLGGLKNVKAVMVAAGSKNGQAVLEVSKENLGDHRIQRSKIKDQKSKINLKVKIRKIDDLAGDNVDLMKIDVQGFENEVIEGAKEIIQKYRPTIFWEISKKKDFGQDKNTYDFLKTIYGDIYFVDEYIQIYYSVSFEWIKKYLAKKEQGNFVVFRDNGLKTRWGGTKDFWLKKWVKRAMGRLET